MIKDIIKTDLKKITLEKGSVYHGVKKSDIGFKNFGELYFSEIYLNQIKAWKRHTSMTLNLIVPYGNVLFVFIDTNEELRKEIIGEIQYVRLTVPPGIWFGFKGLHSPYSLVTNVADIEHKAEEVERKPIEAFSFNW